MKTSMEGDNQEPDHERKTPRSGLRRLVRSVGIVVFSFLAGMVILGAWYVLSEPNAADIEHEWTLRWPGTPPGATFSTQPGDDIRRMLEILRADTKSDWQGPLAEKGAIEIQLAHHEMPSFWERLSWAIRAPKGSMGLQARVVPMATVGVQVVSAEPKRYEVMLRRPDAPETVTGTFDSFERAEAAVLDDLATVMETLQGGQET